MGVPRGIVIRVRGSCSWFVFVNGRGQGSVVRDQGSGGVFVIRDR
jgi:hypothetical protein